MKILCIDCGIEVEKRSPRQIRCPLCSKKKNLLRAKERQRGRIPKDKNRTDICEVCGNEFSYYLNGRVRKYCDGCKDWAYKEKDGRTSLKDMSRVRRMLYHMGHVVFMINHRSKKQ